MSEQLRRVFARPLPWLLIYGALIAYGIYAWLHIPVEVLPRFNYPQISVITHDAGATAEELETRITRPIEGQILALPNLVTVRSTMGHGSVQTNVRFTRGSNAQQDLQAVNSAIDRARGDLPAAAQPYAEIMGNAINEVADYTAHIPAGVAPVAVQRAVRATIEPALRALPGVQRVEVYGSGDEALWVQPDLAALHRYGVPVTALTSALKQHVLLRSGGFIHQGHQHVLIEARSLPTKASDLAQIPVPSRSGPIALHDLARVVRAPVPTQNAVQLDGRASIAVTVFKQPGASTLPVTRAVQAALKQTRNQLPNGVHWVRTYSQGHLVQLIGSDLGRNLLIGALLAVGVLFWVLGAGRGIWALALSIPMSILLGIAGLYAFGESLNLMTLGALSVAVGLLADDAIIVLEAIYHRWEAGDERWPGIRRGLADIVSPDVSGSLTTVSVFVPLLFVGGLAGLFFIPFALAMTLAILASLFISLTLIPLGLGFMRARPRARPTAGARALDRLRGRNERLFGVVLRYPRWSLSLCVALLLASVAGLALVSVNFLPLPNEGVMLASFTLPPGTALRADRVHGGSSHAEAACRSGRGAYLCTHWFGLGHGLYRARLCRRDPDRAQARYWREQPQPDRPAPAQGGPDHRRADGDRYADAGTPGREFVGAAPAVCHPAVWPRYQYPAYALGKNRGALAPCVRAHRYLQQRRLSDHAIAAVAEAGRDGRLRADAGRALSADRPVAGG